MPLLNEASLKIRRGNEDDPKGWSVKLNDLEIAGLLSGENGLKVEFENQEFFDRPMPVVTLKFGPGALDPDFDLPLLQELLERKEKADA